MAPAAQAPMSSPKLGAGSIANRWQKLQGSGSWKGLLEPLDADLRSSVIAYGELAQATYDGLNSDESSPDAGSCLYSQADLLAASGVSHPEYYTVTQFVHASCDPLVEQSPDPSKSVGKVLFVQQQDRRWLSGSPTNWIGYVAVATDKGAAALGRRDIVVAWRGTVKILEYLQNVESRKTSAAQVLAGKFPDAKVDSGALSVYTTNNPAENQRWQSNLFFVQMTSARDQVQAEVRRLVEAHKDEATSITVTGHNLGASLATLNAVDMVAHGANVPHSRPEQAPCPVTAILFGSAPVGDDNFKSAFASFPALRALHVRNAGDVVPVPPAEDVATAVLQIDTDRSPYLRRAGTAAMRSGDDIQAHHNLECYLHGLAGDQGAGKDFKMVVDRDVALVNKTADALKDDYPVPANWWVINPKHKVKGVVGRWKLDNFPDE